MAELDLYRAKRDFRRTAEPSGKTGRKRSAEKAAVGGAFVIHKHAARRLHYDLRLEHGGVLWSWAVTRGPSLDPADKRLAVHVEDHPLDYGAFEGNIPKGQYGGGAVIVWDEGQWLPEIDPAAGMKKGHLRFALRGHKLNGGWNLVRLQPKRGEKRDNWLLIKSKDEAARADGDILLEEPRSVKSGLTIEDIEAGKTPVARKKAEKVAREKKATKPARRKSGVALPDFVEPCLATLRDNPPAGDEWLHEIKFDGYRTQARVDRGKVKLSTRTGLDWTKKFGARIPVALADLPCDAALIDGEVVVMDDKGVSSFGALQAALSEGRSDGMAFFAFDLLHLDGVDLRSDPLLARKERLEDLLGGKADDALRYSEHFIEPGQAMLKHACRMGLEGVVSKRADAAYRSGRSLDWIKSKCVQRQEFVIAGYLPSAASGRGLRSLIVGYHENGALRPAGHVGTGFTAKSGDALKKKLDRLKADKSPLTGAPAKEKGAVWVRPDLVAEVEFGSWTSDRILRHASFIGLREDKPAGDIVAERPAPMKDEPAGEKKGDAKAKSAKATGASAGVKLTNPDKLLWPDAKLSKSGLLAYYESVWPRMKLFVIDRPLSLLRAPNGVGGQSFFQKHAAPGMHAAISTMKDPGDGEELLFIRDFDGLAALVQLGVVEIHLWGVKIETIEQPDQIIFDLDPDEGVDVKRVREAALEVGSRLKELGFPSFAKTSGGKGFHVVVSLKAKAAWKEIKTFAHDFARAMEQAQPKLYTATLSKKARTGRIFIDYLRNGRGSTAVAPYSSRARKTASVSMPIDWGQVEKGARPDDYLIGGAKLKSALKTADPWAAFWKSAKALSRQT